MRGVINTLVLSIARRAGGPPGNQAARCTYSAAFYPFQQGRRGDGTACTIYLMQRLLAGCTVPEVGRLRRALKPWALDGSDASQCNKGNCGPCRYKNYSYLSSPWCNPPVVWVSGAETSIKTWRLSLNLSLALRRKQPRPEFFCLFSRRHTCTWVLPAGLCRERDRS